MVKKIDSDALGDVKNALGLSGSGSPITELTDGVVDQVLEINELVRRGRTLAGTSGIFTPTLRNVHTDAETLTTTINPYAVGTVAAVAPYPAAVPAQFDVWLLGCGMRRVSGGGTLTATLSMTLGTRAQGFGIDDSGTQILVAQPIRLAFFNALSTVVTAFGQQADLYPWKPIGLRIPRFGANLVFSSISSVTVSYDMQLVIGLFPSGLGQDALVLGR